MRSRYIRKVIRIAVLLRDEFTCQECGTYDELAELHIDHIFPFSLGGDHSMDNLQVLCAECNLKKSNTVVN